MKSHDGLVHQSLEAFVLQPRESSTPSEAAMAELRFGRFQLTIALSLILGVPVLCQWVGHWRAP
jgi:hypothetical protein